MIRASFLYRSAPEGRFDFDYYVGRHVPLARRLLAEHALLRLEVDRGVSAEERGSTPPYVCAAHLYFASVEHFYIAMDAVGDELGRDVPNYTDLVMDVLVSECVA